MWYAQTRSHWLARRALWRGRGKKYGPGAVSEREVIRRNADWLLEHLFVPNAEIGCRASNMLLKKNGLDPEEPINWGDISAYAEKKGQSWVVTLEEAAAGQCPKLCKYVRRWLEAWGWKNVVVETMW